MRPIILKGHERSITKVLYNNDADLLFTCSKDHKPTVWYADNGERIGTYNGHNGTIWSMSVDYFSNRLLTASADTFVFLWDVQSGTKLFEFKHKSPVRDVAFAMGDQQMLTVNEPSMGQVTTLSIFKLAEDLEDQSATPYAHQLLGTSKINSAVWGPLNQTILTSGDDGYIRVFDANTLQEVQAVHAHTGPIQQIEMSRDQTMFISASSDYSAKLFDTKTCNVLKTYQSDRPVNAAAISPIMDHVIIGGGQEAAKVTTSDVRLGKFEVQFFHQIYQEEIYTVKGHFGPINTLAFNTDGKSFTSGAEDGYVRVHHFDQDYFDDQD